MKVTLSLYEKVLFSVFAFFMGTKLMGYFFDSAFAFDVSVSFLILFACLVTGRGFEIFLNFEKNDRLKEVLSVFYDMEKQ